MNLHRIAKTLSAETEASRQASIVEKIVASKLQDLKRERNELISQMRSIRLRSGVSPEEKNKQLEEIKKRVETLDDQIKNETKFGFEIYHKGEYQGFSKEETLEDDLAQLGLEKNQVKLVRKPLLNQ